MLLFQSADLSVLPNRRRPASIGPVWDGEAVPLPTTTDEMNAELLSGDLLDTVLMAQKSGESFLDARFDDFEMSSRLAEPAQIDDIDFLKLTQPLSIDEFAVNTLGDPFLVMRWYENNEANLRS